MGYARHPGWRIDDVDLETVDDLLPALAEAFATQAEAAVEQGLLQGYVEVDDQLTVLRGRLRDQEQLRRRFGIAVPLLVRYDDHTVDITENRLLRSATDLLLRVPGVAPQIRVRLRGLLQVLGEVTPLARGARLPLSLLGSQPD
jgi:5-methylcytosine-specific restriction enzyme subunit McrC